NASEHLVDVLENVGRLNPHHPHADGFEALVAAGRDRLGLVAFVDVDRHAEEVAVEIEDGRADDGVASELVPPEVRLGEALGEHLVRLARMPPQIARPLMQRVEPLLRNLPPAPPLLELGSLGGRFKLESALLGHPTLPSRLIPSSFCASTANSIGNCCSTSLAKPLTISATASSCPSPRCIA